MASETVPGPMPLAPPTTEIQDAAEVAVHVQPDPADTFTDTVEAAAPTETALLESAAVHELPACETVNVRPAIVIVPTRANGDVFGATEY
jgi:hypothetical protein